MIWPGIIILHFMKCVVMFSAAEQHDASRLEEEFMSSVRLGQMEQIEHLVS